MTESFTYTDKRRPLVSLLETGLVVALLWLAWAYSAPWWIWAIWAPAAAALAWHAWLAPPAGTIIDDRTLTFFGGTMRHSYPLADIVSVRVTEWSDGPDSYTILLRNGAEIAPPPRAQPPGRQLADELRRRGVSVSGP